MQLTTLINAIRTIQNGDKHWVPAEYRGAVTFFADNDQWQFIASNLSNMCPVCEGMDLEYFQGPDVRTEFPYLEIIEGNQIYARVHPNCSCALARMGDVIEEPPVEEKVKSESPPPLEKQVTQTSKEPEQKEPEQPVTEPTKEPLPSTVETPKQVEPTVKIPEDVPEIREALKGQTWKQAVQNPDTPDGDYEDLLMMLYVYGYMSATSMKLLLKRKKNQKRTEATQK
jgi:hypothetical protein